MTDRSILDEQVDSHRGEGAMPYDRRGGLDLWRTKLARFASERGLTERQAVAVLFDAAHPTSMVDLVRDPDADRHLALLASELGLAAIAHPEAIAVSPAAWLLEVATPHGSDAPELDVEPARFAAART